MRLPNLRRFASNVLAMAYREATVMRHDQAFMAIITVQPIVMLLLFGGLIRMVGRILAEAGRVAEENRLFV